MAAGFPASFTLSVRGWLTLITEAFSQAAAKMISRTLRIVRIVGILFAGEKNMKGVVDIVIPLSVYTTVYRPDCRQEFCIRLSWPQFSWKQLFAMEVPCCIVVVFENKMDDSVIRKALSNSLGKFGQDVWM